MKNKQKDVCIENFYELMDTLCSTSLASGFEANYEPSSTDDYLSRGERLLSLAKNKYKDMAEKLSFNDFEEGLFSLVIKNLNDLYSVLDGIEGYVRKILRGAKSPNDALFVQMMSAIDEHYNASIQFVDVNMEPGRVHRKQVAAGDQCLLLTIKEDGYAPLSVYGLKNHKHTKSWHNKLSRSGATIADIPEVVSWLLFLSYVPKTCKKNNVPVGRACPCDMFYSFSKEIYTAFGVSREEMQTYDVWKFRFIVPADKAIFVQSYGWLFDEMGVEVEVSEQNEKDLFDSYAKKLTYGAYSSITDVPILLNQGRMDALLAGCLGDVLNVKHFIPLHIFLYTRSEGEQLAKRNQNGFNTYWAIPWDNLRLLRQSPLFSSFALEFKSNNAKIALLNEVKSASKEHAKSFQTKKNIPKATLALMESSKLNSYFGYVEYDESVDLEKAEIVTKQFIAFKEKYFKSIDSSQCSIRFRKLGNHHALGLYFPAFGCLCVDVSSPSSLTHEFGHMIDSILGQLSVQSKFVRICNMYERELRNQMISDVEFSKRMNRKGKYGLSYYLNPSEIFARSFEIYCIKVLGINNSLLPAVESLGPEYPLNDQYILLVKEYFSDLFSHKNDIAA